MSDRNDGRPKRPSRGRTFWPDRVRRAGATIVIAAGTIGMGLRQVFYRLVSDGVLDNEHSDYQGLSDRSADWREDGTFPDLIDNRRSVHLPKSFNDPAEALAWLITVYRRPRNEGQQYNVYIGNEKEGNVAQLRAWFQERGIPVLALGGWSSLSYVQKVRKHIAEDGRPAILIYAGDFDPSGAYIGEDFADRVGTFDEVIRVAVNLTQVDPRATNPLVQNPTPFASSKDPRAERFRTDFGPALVAMGLAVPARIVRVPGLKKQKITVEADEIVQYEVEAFAPADLHALYEAALAPYWDEAAYQASLAQEADDIEELEAM